MKSGQAWQFWALLGIGGFSLIMTLLAGTQQLNATPWDLAKLFSTTAGFLTLSFMIWGAMTLWYVYKQEPLAFLMYAAFNVLNLLWLLANLATVSLVYLVFPAVLLGLLYLNKSQFTQCAATPQFLR